MPEGFEALLLCLGTSRHGRILVCGIKGSNVRRTLCPTIADAMRVARFFEKEGNDVFFGPNPRRGTGGREHVVAAVCLHADLDKPSAALGTLPEPSALVCSGRGHHVYWVLDVPAPLDAAERACKGIAARLGADSCWDSSRVLRVPGTTNKKHGGPYPVSLLSVGNGAHSIERFPQEETLRAAGHPLSPCSYDPARVAALHTQAIRVKEDGRVDRSMSDWVFARLCLGSGLSEDETAAALLDFPHGKAAQRGASYLASTIAGARDSILLPEDVFFGI